MPEKINLTGKTALVSGSSKGIGKAIALSLAEAGANIILSSRSSGNLSIAATEVKRFGGKVDEVVIDFENIDALQGNLEKCLDSYGPVDILVNNSGGRKTPEVLHEQTLTSWNQTLNRNLTNDFVCMNVIGKSMIEHGIAGRIINIASMNAFVVNKDIGNRGYEAAKAALVQLTRSAAADWAKYGITVNAICPGLIMTEANEKWMQTNPRVIEALISNIPVGRPGKPVEIGALALYLASPLSAYMTGATLVIDGGYTLW